MSQPELRCYAGWLWSLAQLHVTVIQLTLISNHFIHIKYHIISQINKIFIYLGSQHDILLSTKIKFDLMNTLKSYASWFLIICTFSLI